MNYDLFNEATVTLDDVELWLRCIPRFSDNDAPTRVLQYTETYDIYNKIMRAKVNKSFYDLVATDKQNLSYTLQDLIKPKFRPLQIAPHSVLRQREARHLAQSKSVQT